ncbi:isochorismate synthase MenF [Myxosarcina sp. GI1]|uniref:isochorismate synthase n=1 Tax=Myxosarcina sp. GI1 TaxID=1541065 RepID=UPI00209FAF44|nr:isochorismate synthase [Myxosarcina sp. GI1]
MTLVPQAHQSVPSNVELDDFWHNKNLHFAVTDETRIISYTRRIPPADPLAFLQKFACPNSKHFYWENPRKQEAVAAYGITKSTNIASLKRFELAQKFVKECFQQIIRKGENNLTEGKPCVFCNFTFSPKVSEESFSVSTLFLPRFQLIRKNKSYYIIVNFPLQESDSESAIVKQIEQKINSINWSDFKIQISDSCIQNSIDYSETSNSKHFKSVVSLALRSIAKSELSKVVIAHTTELQASIPFQLIKSLNSLREQHPDCYIFSTSNGRGQNFIGASPERLVSIQNKQLVTDALAGSTSRGKTSTEDLYLANLLLKNRKEKREHQAVSNFLIERLRQLNLKPQQLPLQVLKLSNIQHLWTPVYAHLSLDIEPLEIVARLHPTPAVAGIPTAIACEKIQQYEECDRSLYAAPLGWVDLDDNCEFIVGIRSALIDGNRARLYAGAGIVSGSEPEKEFAEVQLKLQSLMKALVQA